MYKINIIITILTFFMFLISCEKEIELKLDKGQDKLVVNSLFYPDTNFRVYVTSTKLINENKNTFINNADVKLYKNGVFLETLNLEANGWYVTSTKPEYDTKYKVEVTQGNRFVFAESYVPQQINYFHGDFSVNFNLGGNQPNSEITFYEIVYNYYFLDNENTENYYHIMEGFQLQIQQDYENINNISLIEDSELNYNPKSLFFSDKYFNGDTTLINVNILKDNWIGEIPPPFSGVLKSTSREYYLFLKTWVKHQNNQNSDINLNQPTKLIFQGQPIEMYSNVVGGYGVFAGFNKTIVEFVYVP